MSVVTLKNGELTAAIDAVGAQLTSLALGGKEYLWQADPAVWGKHAPILSPSWAPSAMARRSLPRAR